MHTQPAQDQRRRRWRRPVTLILALLVLVGGGWAGYQTSQLIQRIQSLKARLAQAQALAGQPPAEIDLAQIGTLIKGARDDSVALRAAARPFLAVAPYLGWVPIYGGDLQAAPALLDMSVELTTAVATGLDSLKPLEAGVANGTSPSTAGQALAALAQAAPGLEQAGGHLQAARAARQKIDPQRLSAQTASLVAQADRALAWLGLAIEGGLLLPDVLGLNSSRQYLLLVQNEDEIRPTGGFISAAGLVRLENGAITEQHFEDSYAVDDLQAHAYPEPPAPLFTYMGSELWLFRDSNWSPDFPTSARQAAEFYRLGRGIQVDGVIAVDQRATQLIVGALGPLPPLPGESQPITAEGLIGKMRASRSQDPNAFKRKDFIGQIAAALQRRLDQGLTRGDVVKLASALRQGLEERHILIYLPEPRAAQLMAAQGWDGALRATDGDFLMVVDANVGFNKANALVEEKVSYAVDLSDPARPEADVRLTYQHHGRASQQSCNIRAPLVLDYDMMAERCYWDYVRLLVPLGSQLQWASRHPLAGEETLSGQPLSGETESQIESGASDKLAWGKLLLVPVGASADSRFVYALPASVVRREGSLRRYSLLVQKQPGTPAVPLTVTIALPAGAVVASASPTPIAYEGGQVRFELQLNTDRRIDVRFR